MEAIFQIMGKFTYLTELLLAQLIFLFPFPKRKKFFLRLIIGIVANEVFWYFYPTIRIYPSTPLTMFLELWIRIIMTILTMWLCFDSSIWPIASACVGGVALQHIGYQVSMLVARLFFGKWTVMIEAVTCILLYVIVLITVGLPLSKQRFYENYDKRMIILSFVIILICIGIIRFYREYRDAPIEIVLMICIYSITCNLLALYIQFFWYRFAMLKSDYLVLQRIHEEEVKQYENSKINNKLLNIKCHDLKHSMASLEDRFPPEEVEAMRKIIDVYDNKYHSEMEVLDVIVNEKIIRCMSKGIAFTLMGDTMKLSFMRTMDLYSLFGNMIENAIEAVDKIDDPTKKTISVVIEGKGELVTINCVNYTNQTYDFEGGLPQTTKRGETGYHGYGLMSIKQIAEAYQGGITVTAEDDVFSLSVYMLPNS